MVMQIKLVVVVVEIHLLLHGGLEPVPKPDCHAFQKEPYGHSLPEHVTPWLLSQPFCLASNRFFSLFPCARQIRIQMFFPRSFLLVSFRSFSAPKNAPFSVAVPDLCPRKFWWPLVSRNAACAFKFGSKGDTNILCGNHALYSGIFGWFGSPPFEIALFTRLGSPRPCSSCAKSDSDLLVVILPFVSLA